MGSNKESSRPPSANSYRTHYERPSTADPGQGRKTSLSNVSDGPRNGLARTKSDGAPLSAGPATTRPFVLGNGSTHPPLPSAPPNLSASNFGTSDNRSIAFPFDGRNHTEISGPLKALPRRPSEPASLPSSAYHPRRPSVAAANRPLYEIGSTSSYKPSRPPTSRSESPAMSDTGAIAPRSASRNGGRNDQKTNIVVSIPTPKYAEDYSVGNPYHTPTESTSSNDSATSDANSGSSRSSPPLSDSPFHMQPRFAESTPIESLRNDNGVTHSSKAHAKEEHLKTRQGPAKSFNRPIYAQSAEPVPPPELLIQPPESPMDPAIRSNRLYSPAQSTPSASVSPQTMTYHSTPRPTPPRANTVTPPPAPRPPIPSPSRRPTAGKGNCRGCGELIQGKSVSSADGRLTGRYHKRCFVCQTCQEPFKTTDFYVLNNQPYCGRHYHELNGSLCQTCDKGIEGQYLETAVKQKFHPHCFTCQVSFCPVGTASYRFNFRLLILWGGKTGLPSTSA